MLALVAAWRWLLSLPRIVLVCLLAALLIVGGLWFTYHAGQKAGETTVHREALQDSAVTAHTKVQQTTDSTERGRTMVKKLAHWSDSSRTIRQELRAAVVLDSLPEPVVTLIRHDDNVIRRDSSTIAAFVKLDSAWVAERAARIAADSVESHQITLGVEPQKKGHGKLIVGTVIVTTVAVKAGPAIVHALLHLVHR